MSESVTVHRAGRSDPTLNLSDGHEVVTAYSGPDDLRVALEQNLAEPLSLASADFDEDGVPDLVGGYEYQGRGVLSLLRGNVDSIYPNAPEAKQLRANGTFTDAPFLSPARLSGVPVAADFVGAGDFDGDSHWDVVVASRTRSRLYLLSGDGRGGLAPAKEILLPGVITAFVTGEINRRDGLTDVVVGIDGPEGPRVLVFEGPNGALKAEPEIFSMPAAVASLALGQLDNEYPIDLAVAAGQEVLIVHGRDRKLSLDHKQQSAVPAAKIDSRSFPVPVRSVVIGNFSGQASGIATLMEDGDVRLITQNSGGVPKEKNKNHRRVGSQRLVEGRSESLSVGRWPQASQLVTMSGSSPPTANLVVTDSVNHQLHILAGRHVDTGNVSPDQILNPGEARNKWVTLDMDGGGVVAVLPMTLNGDALSDFVTLNSSRVTPTVIQSVAATTFVVNSAADTDDGVCNAANCTLREAINAANISPGADTINFNIATGSQTIIPLSPLPDISDPVTIDGSTQPGFAGVPIIELNGASAGINASGLKIIAGNSRLKGLVINRFDYAGIWLKTNGGDVVDGNFIGTNAAGTAVLSNSSFGLLISQIPNNLVGGTTASARNLISGNGTRTQTSAEGVGLSIQLGATDNLVQGNYVGTDATGAIALANATIGVWIIGASNNAIGGMIAGAGNVISGNDNGEGTEISGFDNNRGASGNVVQGNFIGTNATGSSALGNIYGLSLEFGASNNTVGGTVAAARNVISGNFLEGALIQFVGTSGNIIQGNSIGTDTAGTVRVHNRSGVLINNASDNFIGGAISGAGNLISGNNGGGVVLIVNAASNVIQGNLIGTDITGTAAVGNLNSGVFIQNANNNTVGGEVPGARNVISGNVGAGVALYGGPTNQGPGTAGSNGNKIEGNFIGTDIAGTAQVANIGDGIQITATSSSTNNVIGGLTANSRNIISGNSGSGINVGIHLNSPVPNTQLTGTGGTGIIVQNNYIGTDVSSMARLGNGRDGIYMEVNSLTNFIRTNVIGFNGRTGVRIPNLSENFNTNGTPAFQISLDSNQIYSNTGLGIDLGDAGITPNDPGDADVGANLQQNFPVLTSSAPSGPSKTEVGAKERFDLNGSEIPSSAEATLTVSGTLNSTPNTTFTIHWYFSADSQCVTNQASSRPLATGKLPGITTDVNGNALFSFPFDLPTGTNGGIINCTATDPNGNTSEFSACLPVTRTSPRTLTIASTNPASGVNITVTPGDNNSQSNGATQFTRIYNSDSVVTLTAPATASGNSFQKWQRDGADFELTQFTRVTMDANHTMTAVYVTPQWQPVVLTGQQIAQIKAWTVGGRTYVYVKPQFPDAGYRVVNWGQVGRSGSDFTVDASVERFTGASIQSVVTAAQIYDLGPLADGTYNFNFKTSGTLAKTLQFTVSSVTPPANPIDSAREFVKQQYRDFLNREADQAGEDFWTDNITLCSNPARRPAGQTEAQCTLRQRETTSGAFFRSPEFQYTGYFVYRMYQGALGRQPKLSEFTPDAQFVGSGIIVNGQLSAAKINQNKADFAAQFVNCTDATKYRCAEFKAIYDGLNNQQYVDKLFLTTSVNASTSDRTALVNGLNGGSETRASVLQKVVDGIVVIAEGNQQFTTSYGQAFYNSESNRAFVQLEYFGYMKRDPDDAGYAFWLGKLNQFGGNFVNAEMVLAFISSPEYRARFGQP